MVVQLFEYVVMLINGKKMSKNRKVRVWGLLIRNESLYELNTIETKGQTLRMLEAANLWLPSSVHWSRAG